MKKNLIIQLITSILVFIVSIFLISLGYEIFVNKNFSISFDLIWNNIKNHHLTFVLISALFTLCVFLFMFLKSYFSSKTTNSSKTKTKKTDKKESDGFLIDQREKNSKQLKSSNKKNEKVFDEKIAKKNDSPSKAGFVVRWEKNKDKYVWWTVEEYHMKVIATTGGGKSQCFIIPNILYNTFLPDAIKPNLLIIDGKKELENDTWNSLKKANYNVLSLDLRNGFDSMGWNPLAIIFEKYISDDKRVHADAISEFNYLLTTIQAYNLKKSKDPLWPDGARNLATAAAYFILEMHKLKPDLVKKHHFNFTNLRILIANIERFKILLHTASSFSKKIYEIAEDVSGTLNAPDETLGGFVANATSGLSLFYQDLKLRNLLSRDEFRPAILSNPKNSRPTALFVSYSTEDTTNNDLISMLLMQVVNEAFKFARQTKALKLKRELRIIIDEFYMLNKMQDFDRTINIARSFGILILIASQSESQIHAVYGKEAGPLLQGFNSSVFVSTNEDADKSKISARLGKVEISKFSETTSADNKVSKTMSKVEKNLLEIKDIDLLGEDYYLLETTGRKSSILKKSYTWKEFKLKKVQKKYHELKDIDDGVFRFDFDELLNILQDEIKSENGEDYSEEQKQENNALSEVLIEFPKNSLDANKNIDKSSAESILEKVQNQNSVNNDFDDEDIENYSESEIEEFLDEF